MGRPPQPPRSYVTRHLRFRRALDIAIRRAAEADRRRFNDFVVMILEDWLAARAEPAGEPEPEPLPPRRGGQARQPPRKP